MKYSIITINYNNKQGLKLISQELYISSLMEVQLMAVRIFSKNMTLISITGYQSQTKASTMP